ncbi:RNA-guided endonuclease IscB [Streptomyces mutabilis]|uniref:RNA-guided endonuclease IscB n=1 Tax=Streptomyces mutabilis TaxID=67332 RepID=UPI0022BA2BE2|nr:RNA-guided endonuclease IscB [Streptomyces mutabilis]
MAEKGNGDIPTKSRRYEGGVGAARVFVLSKEGHPLMPCHPARARELLGRSRAVVVRRIPFVIRLRDRTLAQSEACGVQLRIDPGSEGTGLVITDEKKETDARDTVRRGLFALELQHRGDQIRRRMQQRAGYRRRRRSANLRYRAPRSSNRTRKAAWLPPSVRHRVDTTFSWADRLCRFAPIGEIHVEHVAFDMHQRGRVRETSVRSRLKDLWNNACAYCDASETALNIEHVRPRSRGGSSRTSNLVVACVPCNQAKGSKAVEDFLAHRPHRLAAILQQLERPLDDAAAMNALRPRLTEALGGLGKRVLTWSGRITERTRSSSSLAKTHTLDALAVGRPDHQDEARIVRIPERLLVARATGRGSYARTTPDRFGFPRLRRPRARQHFGFVTGDLVLATVPVGRWAGTWTGRVSVRARGQHSVATPSGRINVSHAHLRVLQRGDGYTYETRLEASTPRTQENWLIGGRDLLSVGRTPKGGDPANERQPDA